MDKNKNNIFLVRYSTMFYNNVIYYNFNHKIKNKMRPCSMKCYFVSPLVKKGIPWYNESRLI